MSVGRAVGSVVVIVAGILGVVDAGRAVAGEASKTEALIREGVELRTEGRDARALPLFQQAYELERTPRTAGQLGLCELALGYWLDAEAHLAEGLATVSHPWIEQNRPVLTAALAKAAENLGEVMLAGGPAGAEVVVDRREVGRLPLVHPLRLIKGPHDVEVRVEGREPWRKAVAVAGADKQTLVVVIVVERPAAAVVAEKRAAEDPGSRVEETEEPGGARRGVAWVAAVAGVAALGAGVYGTVGWIHQNRAFDRHTAVDPNDPSMRYPDCSNDLTLHGGAECDAIHSDLAKARLITLVSYGAAVLLGAGSVYLFATAPTAGRKSDAAMSCVPDAVARGLSCAVRF
jgi:hypothetical protein